MLDTNKLDNEENERKSKVSSFSILGLWLKNLVKLKVLYWLYYV
jgi:hypothetical protein